MKPTRTTTAFEFLNSAFKITELFYRIREVGSENDVFVRTITVVRNDLSEIERLIYLPSVVKKLLSTPAKLAWIKGSIHSTKSALNEIGKWVEKARMEQQTLGAVKFETRVKWIFNDHEKLVNRQSELSTCHQQLANVLGYLVSMEEAVVRKESLTYGDATCFDDLVSPRQRRRIRQPAKAGLTSEKHSPLPLHKVASPTPHVTQDFIDMPDPASFAFIHSHQNSFQANDEDISGRSPPPAYNTILGPAPLNYDQSYKENNLPYPTDESWEYTYTPNEASVFKSHVDAYPAFRINPYINQEVKEQQIFAYSGTQVQELQGSASTFTATNSRNPVDAYELLSPVPTQQTTPSRRNTGSHREDASQLISKMMATLSFPAELPGHDHISKHSRSAAIPQTRADRSYHGGRRRRHVSSAIAELPAGHEDGRRVTKMRSDRGHSDQEVACYVSRRIQGRRKFRGLMDYFE